MESISPRFFLLIVPYGIETRLLPGAMKRYSLLIVPYGIETKQMMKWDYTII